MVNESRILKDLMRHEGLRLKPYRCTAGKLTIGYGRNIEEVGITEPEAKLLLMADLYRTTKELGRHLPWVMNLAEPRRNVLINMAFNLGITKLKEFKNTLALVKSGDYEGASKEMLNSKWAQQVGPRAKELAHVMKTGSYTIQI